MKPRTKVILGSLVGVLTGANCRKRSAEPIDAAIVLRDSGSIADAPAPIDSWTSAPRPWVLTSASCSSFEEYGRAVELAQDAGAPAFECWSDGGLQISLNLRAPREMLRPMIGAVGMQRTITTMTPRQRSEELGAWRSGSRTDRLYASAALAARSPEAVRGRLAVETGVIISASEEGGVTALSVGVGTYGLRPLTVVYPGTADERIVAEARVRVYGLWSVRDNAATLVAAWLEPL